MLQIYTESAPLEIENGVVRVAGTRVSLDTVIYAFLQGGTAEEIAQQYSVLDLVDVYGAITYYLRHKIEVDQYLQQRQEEAQQLQEEIETRFNPVGIRARLLARSKNAE